jgi:hypothetical protein
LGRHFVHVGSWHTFPVSGVARVRQLSGVDLPCVRRRQTGSPWHSFPGLTMGRARRLCPGISDVNFLCDLKRVVYLHAEVPNSALDLGVAK